MKATDLRIGNLVYYRDKSKVLTVDNIGSKGFSTIDDNGLEYGSDDVSEYNGIELTEEWVLDKFNFYMSEGGFYRLQFDSNFKIFKLGNDDWGIFGMPKMNKKISYVHELQNLYFVLKNKDLTIK